MSRDADHLLSIYKECFGLQRAQFVRIEHKETMVAIVYKVMLTSNKTFLLKICSRDEDFYREIYFLEVLAETLPVPKVKCFLEPAAGRPGGILMEFLEGTLLNECDWTEALAYEIGVKLALLHSIRSEYFGDYVHKNSCEQIPEEYFQGKFFEELEECRTHLPKEIIQFCENYYTSHSDLLGSVDGPCLIHRDFRPGNMIVNDGKLVGIIDWASARFGFAEQDFCSIKHRNWPKSPKHKHSLLRGYSSIRPLPKYEAIMPLLRLGRALAVIGYTVKSGTFRGKDREIYQYNRDYLDNIV